MVGLGNPIFVGVGQSVRITESNSISTEIRGFAYEDGEWLGQAPVNLRNLTVGTSPAYVGLDANYFDESAYTIVNVALVSPKVADEPAGEIVDESLPWEVFERLTYLAELQENWDGEGAPPVAPKTLAKTRAILQKAYDLGVSVLPRPLMAPGYNGMVGIEWETGFGTELIIDVPSEDEPIQFLLVEPNNDENGTETEGEIGETWTWEVLIHRLLGKASHRNL